MKTASFWREISSLSTRERGAFSTRFHSWWSCEMSQDEIWAYSPRLRGLFWHLSSSFLVKQIFKQQNSNYSSSCTDWLVNLFHVEMVFPHFCRDLDQHRPQWDRHRVSEWVVHPIVPSLSPSKWTWQTRKSYASSLWSEKLDLSLSGALHKAETPLRIDAKANSSPAANGSMFHGEQGIVVNAGGEVVLNLELHHDKSWKLELGTGGDRAKYPLMEPWHLIPLFATNLEDESGLTRTV